MAGPTQVPDGSRQSPPGKERSATATGNRPAMARQFALETYRQAREMKLKEKEGGAGAGGEGGGVKLPSILKHTEGTQVGKTVNAFVTQSKCQSAELSLIQTATHANCILTSNHRTPR